LKDASKLSGMLAQVRVTSLQERVISFDEATTTTYYTKPHVELTPEQCKECQDRIVELKKRTTCHNCGNKRPLVWWMSNLLML
jgi:Zn finger protein HypA/HybF involved in hydrogenase expression